MPRSRPCRAYARTRSTMGTHCRRFLPRVAKGVSVGSGRCRHGTILVRPVRRFGQHFRRRGSHGKVPASLNQIDLLRIGQRRGEVRLLQLHPPLLQLANVLGNAVLAQSRYGLRDQFGRQAAYKGQEPPSTPDRQCQALARIFFVRQLSSSRSRWDVAFFGQCATTLRKPEIPYSKDSLNKPIAMPRGAIYPILKLRRRLPPVTARADSPAIDWAAMTISPVSMREG